MSLSFTFNKTSVSRTGKEKVGRNYTIVPKEGNTVTIDQVNTLRQYGFNLKPIEEKDCQDGYDVSGAGKDSPSQVVWKNGRLVAVPYDRSNVRVATTNVKNDVCVIADLMANNTRRIGRPLDGEKANIVSEPVDTYDVRIEKQITGRLKQRIGCPRALLIDTTGANGFTDEHQSKIEAAAGLYGVSIEWV